MDSWRAPATEVRFSPMGSRHHTHHLQLRAGGYLQNGPCGFPGGPVVKNTPADAGDARPTRSIPGLGRSPAAGSGSPLVFLPGESHGQRSLVGQSPGSRKRVRHDLATKHQQTQIPDAPNLIREAPSLPT